MDWQNVLLERLGYPAWAGIDRCRSPCRRATFWLPRVGGDRPPA